MTPQRAHVHHWLSMKVPQRWHSQPMGFLLASLLSDDSALIDLFFWFAGGRFDGVDETGPLCVGGEYERLRYELSGRSVVQASQQRYVDGFSSVQISHVQVSWRDGLDA